MEKSLLKLWHYAGYVRELVLSVLNYPLTDGFLLFFGRDWWCFWGVWGWLFFGEVLGGFCWFFGFFFLLVWVCFEGSGV